MEKFVGDKPRGLAPAQELILDGFVEQYAQHSEDTPSYGPYYEETARKIGQSLINGYGLNLANDRIFLATLAGLSVAMVHLERLLHGGLSIDEAGLVVRASLANLYPEQSEQE